MATRLVEAGFDSAIFSTESVEELPNGVATAYRQAKRPRAGQYAEAHVLKWCLRDPSA